MSEMGDNPENDQAPRTPPDATKYASAPLGGYEPHPLFPLDGNLREVRDIQFITFRRRRSDGRIDNLAEDIPAGELVSWADVIEPWGGGEYKAIGKDKNHRVVAWYPEKNGEWTLFDLESKPFTLRGQRYLHSASIGGRGAASAPVAAAVPLAPLAPPAPPAPPAPAAPHPLEATMVEVLRELRFARTPAPVAAPAPTSDPAMVEMIKAQGEIMRTVLSAVLTSRPVEASTRPTIDPTTMALQLLTAMREWAPKPQAQVSITDRLGEYRAIREITTPVTPPAPQSEFGEIKDLMMSVMQADALSKGTRDLKPPPVPERRPPPPPPPSLPRPQLRHVPGVGVVEVVQPEAPLQRPDDRDVDIAAILRDPTQRQRALKALGLDVPASPVVTIAAAPLPEAPVSAPSSAHVAATPAPVAPIAVALPTLMQPLSTASIQPPEPERAQSMAPPAEQPSTLPAPPLPAPPVPVPPMPSPPLPSIPMPEPVPVPPLSSTPIATPTTPLPATPIAAATPLPATPLPATPIATPTPTAPIAVDTRPAIELPEHMPSPEPLALTDEELIHAPGSLASIARLPPDRLRDVLSKVTGIGDVEDLITAVGDIPSEAWPFLATKLPADVVRSLVAEAGG